MQYHAVQILFSWNTKRKLYGNGSFDAVSFGCVFNALSVTIGTVVRALSTKCNLFLQLNLLRTFRSFLHSTYEKSLWTTPSQSTFYSKATDLSCIRYKSLILCCRARTRGSFGTTTHKSVEIRCISLKSTLPLRRRKSLTRTYYVWGSIFRSRVWFTAVNPRLPT